jgi:hypothetical protein
VISLALGVLGRPALAIAVAAVTAFIATSTPSTSGVTKSGDKSSRYCRGSRANVGDQGT